MDEIICYTSYLPEGEERSIDFMELLLDDNWAGGYIECPEKIYSDIGDINHRLAAKQNYEFLFPRATSQVAACRHLATAARVKYPAALQRCKFDTPLLAAGSLIEGGTEISFKGKGEG